MKVVFRKNETATLSAITSVCVRDTGSSVKIVARHRTRRAEKESCITFRSTIHFSPNIKMTKAFAEDIVAEIECLVAHPSLPLERVIDSRAWCVGCLGIDLNTATVPQKTSALARLCVGWSVGGRNEPTDKQLEVRTGLDTDTITGIADTDAYKQCVKELLLNGSLFEPRTAEEFKAWVKSADLPRRFGKRTRLSEEASKRLINEIASTHGIKEPL